MFIYMNMAIQFSVKNETMANISSNTTSNDTELAISKTTIGVVIEVILIAVALGNLLVVLSLRHQKKIIVTDILLCSLSLADVINATFPLQILIITKYLVAKPWEKVVCDIFVVFVNSLRFASAGTIALIALERAFLLVFPLQHHIRVTISRARKAVAVVWVMSVFFGALPLLGVGHSGFDNGRCLYQFYFLGTSTAIVLLSASFLLLSIVLACFIVIKLTSKKFIQRQKIMAPGTMNKHGTVTARKASTADIKSVTTSTISTADTEDVTARRTSAPNIENIPERRTNTPNNMDTKKRESIGSLNKAKGIKEVRRLTRMMAVVVILYYVSFLPVLISNVVILVQKENSSNVVLIMVGGMSLIYALCNPVLYGKMSPRYFRGYKLVIGTALGFCGYRPRSWNTFTTSNSARTSK